VSAGLAWMALQEYEDQLSLEDRLTQAEASAQSALHRARDSMDLRARVAGPYEALAQAGLFAPLDKAQAIDRTEAVLRPHLASIYRYQVGGSHEQLPAPQTGADSYQIELERVSVEFEPLHEERFLDIWKSVAALRAPVGAIENCDLHRGEEVNAPSGSAIESPPIAYMKARCLLTWYRLQGPASSTAPVGPLVPTTVALEAPPSWDLPRLFYDARQRHALEATDIALRQGLHVSGADGAGPRFDGWVTGPNGTHAWVSGLEYRATGRDGTLQAAPGGFDAQASALESGTARLDRQRGELVLRAANHDPQAASSRLRVGESETLTAPPPAP